MEQPKLYSMLQRVLRYAPFRRRESDPLGIVGSLVRPGMTVVAVEPYPGFLSRTLAELVGKEGSVISVTAYKGLPGRPVRQQKRCSGGDRIVFRFTPADLFTIGTLADAADSAFCSSTLHRIPDTARLFGELHAALRPAGTLLITEPVHSMTGKKYGEVVTIAEDAGFIGRPGPEIRGTFSTLLVRLC
jgi:predicted methyltransferase